jgi:DNA-binding response OmpR family regulator
MTLNGLKKLSAPPDPAKDGIGKTILVVEDDKKITSALWVRLKAAGYEVITAGDGDKGLTAALRSEPDLILMDIWLPGSLGFLVAQRLKHFGLESVPIIFLTASKKKELWSMAQEVGAAGFFEKPYDPEKLLAAIAREVRRNSGPAPSAKHQ